MIEIILIKLLNYLDTIPLLILLLVAKNNKALRGSFILYYIIIQLFFNLSANILNELGWKNLYLYHLNCLFSFYALSLFYFQLFNTKQLSRLIAAVAVIFTAIFFFNIYKWESVMVFNSNTFGVASFILCAYALYYYLQLYKNPQPVNLAKSSNFWFNTGIFSYYTISFFIFLTYHKLTEEKAPLLRIVWKLHNFIFLIMCIYFFIGILCKRSRVK